MLPGDENVIVLNTDVLEEEPDLKVGDEVVLEIEERETTWQVVGIAKSVMLGPMAYV